MKVLILILLLVSSVYATKLETVKDGFQGTEYHLTKGIKLWSNTMGEQVQARFRTGNGTDDLYLELAWVRDGFGTRVWFQSEDCLKISFEDGTILVFPFEEICTEVGKSLLFGGSANEATRILTKVEGELKRLLDKKVKPKMIRIEIDNTYRNMKVKKVSDLFKSYDLIKSAN